MTLPDERYSSVKRTREFLLKLAGGEFSRVPKTVREQAAGLLRHYPSEYELKEIEHYAPHVLQQRMEPLYKMIKQHEMADSVAADYKAEGIVKQHPSAAQDPNWEDHL